MAKENIVNKTIALVAEKNSIAVDVTFSREHHKAHIEEGHGTKEVSPDLWLTELHNVSLYVADQEIDILPMLNEDAKAAIVYHTNQIVSF